MIDHLVYGVPDLPGGIEAVEEQLGILPRIGGQHPGRGTWNALFSLGEAVYFELIAVDPKQKPPDAPRWMGIDSIHKPTLLRWAWKSRQMEVDLHLMQQLGFDPGPIQQGRRQRPEGSWLSWHLSDPGNHPGVDVVPFLLDWGDSVHPSQGLPVEVSLEALQVFHPEPKRIQRLYNALSIPIQVQSKEIPQLLAVLRSPKGQVVLG